MNPHGNQSDTWPVESENEHTPPVVFVTAAQLANAPSWKAAVAASFKDGATDEEVRRAVEAFEDGGPR